MTEPQNVTILLDKARAGDRAAVSQLFRVVNKRLRSMAGHMMRQERADHILQPTELVGELYLRLFAGQKLEAKASAQFFHLAGRVMHHILIDYARRRDAGMRRGIPVQLEDRHAVVAADPDELALLKLAIRRLERHDARAASIFNLHYFSGQELADIAAMLELNVRMVQRDLRAARLWLSRELRGSENVTGTVG